MTTVLIISILLFLIYSALIIYYRQGWVSIPQFEAVVLRGRHTTKISVIIPARNEGQNIKDCLDSIRDQSYPKDLFEVIVVNDHSTDNTAAVIDEYAGQNIKRIDLADHIGDHLNAYKKKAIEVGIQQSAGELIITTDADCIVPPNWLQTIAAFYEMRHPVFIAAPVSINCSNRFIEKFQALDFMVLQGITGAAVQKQMHSMCNGANLAYQKEAFEKVDGFKGIDNIASGDDMLLMHKIFKRYPTKLLFLKSKAAIVQTAPVHSIREFFQQRIRWASKADKFGDKSLFPVLLIVYLFNLMMLVVPIISIFNNVQYSVFNIQCSLITVWLWMLLLKTLIELIFLYPVAKFFGKQNMLKVFPLMQPFSIVYTVIAGWLGKFGSYEWKGRKVR